jgi:hypothetical protein
VGDWLALFFAQKVEVGSSMHSSWKSLGFWPNSFEGVLGVVRKSRGLLFRVLLHLDLTIFQTFPPSPPLPDVLKSQNSCVSSELFDQEG